MVKFVVDLKLGKVAPQLLNPPVLLRLVRSLFCRSRHRRCGPLNVKTEGGGAGAGRGRIKGQRAKEHQLTSSIRLEPSGVLPSHRRRQPQAQLFNVGDDADHPASDR